MADSSNLRSTMNGTSSSMSPPDYPTPPSSSPSNQISTMVVADDFILSPEIIDGTASNPDSMMYSSSPTVSSNGATLTSQASAKGLIPPSLSDVFSGTQLSSDLVSLSKGFPIRLQSRATTALSSYSAPPARPGSPPSASSTGVSSTASSSPASSVSSPPKDGSDLVSPSVVQSSSPNVGKSPAKPSIGSRTIIPSISSAPDIKTMLGRILNSYDPLGRPYTSTFNNSFIETEVDDDSVTVFDDYDLDDDDDDQIGGDEMDRFLAQRKQFFILSYAGKPIFSLHGSDDLISAHMAIIQALVAGFEQPSDDFPTDQTHDQLRFFTAGTTSFAITIEDPLILVAISKLGETEAQLRTQMDALNTLLLSALTKAQIIKVFRGRTNFDLRKLLGGTEMFLRALAREMAIGSPAILLNSVECLRLRNSVRERINTALLAGRTQSLLYGLLVADGRLVSVIRPKRHSLHPPDLQVIFSMLFHNNIFHDGREHWIPICLPKFNNRGFLHAYIVFFRPKVALVLISANKDSFYELRKSKEDILENLKQERCIPPIEMAVKLVRYRTEDIGVPAIQHFLYKSRSNVQFTMPNYEPHFPDRKSQHDLMCLYRRLHAAIHTRHTHLKVLYVSRGTTVALAWATHSFEVYCVASAETSKATLANGMDRIIAWVKREESRLFISNGAVSGLSFSAKDFFSLAPVAIYA
ncbi:trafficking protein Mon1-domain-containing protein [Lipomyces oligophaga]|uniref:trafficking protein Mon1-domain-containing protein n=1 Tax=Lipomyces oligophaga TaxID=45792 RepID=UPI0034CE5AD7